MEQEDALTRPKNDNQYGPQQAVYNGGTIYAPQQILQKLQPISIKTEENN